MDGDEQERLMNWDYTICDADLRAHVDSAKFEISIGAPRFPDHLGALAPLHRLLVEVVTIEPHLF
jgi:hypothetical protein